MPDELLTLIHQPWAWYTREQLLHLNFPKANKDIIKRLYWPHFIKISPMLAPVENDDTLVYWRNEKDSFDQADLEKLALLDTNQLSKLIVNVDVWHKLKPEL